ncbi:hypothetical protein [Acrocarpospora pleiomorpha]|nr:hypothetical protein [Acrocarpospora pleiomorpha]
MSERVAVGASQEIPPSEWGRRTAVGPWIFALVVGLMVVLL